MLFNYFTWYILACLNHNIVAATIEISEQMKKNKNDMLYRHKV